MVSTTSESTVVTGLTKPAPEPLLSIRNFAKHFGKTIVLRDISLDIAEGEFLTILGESGSGKTTLLRIIAGFETANSGQLWMSGERLDRLPPYRRRVNTVFQHYALFPHLTVEENVAYGLRIAKISQPEVASRVEQALAMVKMSSFAKSKPAKISGGQQPRVALARALITRPATAYTAQFIGHTNLLRAQVSGGIARCQCLSWPTQLEDGAVLFSLRPENIHLATSISGSDTARFRAKVRNLAFHGATMLLQ